LVSHKFQGAADKKNPALLPGGFHVVYYGTLATCRTNIHNQTKFAALACGQ
jgi:hypothetical protein